MTTQEYEAIFLDPQTSSAQLAELFGQDSSVEMSQALRNPQIPLRVLRRAQFASSYTIQMVARSALESRSRQPEPDPIASEAEITLADLANAEVPLKVLRKAQLSRDRKVRKRANELLKAIADARIARKPLNLAGSPTATLEELRQLVGHSSRRVRDRARDNSSLPENLKLALEILPTSRDLDLEQMLELAQCGLWVQRELLMRPGLPPEVFRAVAENGGADLVAVHPEAPQNLLRDLASKGSSHLRQLVAENPALSGNLLEMLARNSAEDEFLRVRVAAHPNLKPTLMTRFVQDDDWEVRESLSRNPNLSREAILTLAADHWNEEVALYLAKQHRLPVEVIERLMEWPNKKVRRLLASHPKTPNHVLEQLSLDEDAKVRLEVAAHFATPAGVLSRLAADVDSTVQRAAQGGELGHSNPALRRAALRNPLLTRDELEAVIAKEDDWLVRRVMMAHPAFPDELRQAELHGTRQTQLTRRRDTMAWRQPRPDQGLDEYRKEVYKQLRPPDFTQLDTGAQLEFRMEAASTSLTPSLARFLYEYGHETVKESLCLNPKTPLDICIRLAREKVYFRELLEHKIRNLGDNPTYKDYCTRLERDIEAIDIEEAKGNDGSSIDDGLRLRFVSSPSIKVRLAFLDNPDCPPEAVAALSRDSETNVRKKVAGLNQVSEEVLVQLALDSEEPVAKEVMERQPLPHAVLVQLARSPISSVRTRLAKEERTPDEALVILARDVEEDVIRALLDRNNRYVLSAPVLLALAQSPIKSELSISVRTLVMSHKNTPPEALRYMFQWKEEWPSLAAKATTPGDLLEKLYRASGSNLLLPLARHPNATARLLESIVRSRAGIHWQLLFWFSSFLPLESLQREERQYQQLMEAIRRNPNCPPRLRNAIDRPRRGLAYLGAALVLILVMAGGLTWWRFEWLMTVSSPLCINPPAPEIVAGQTIKQTIFEEIRVGTGREARIGSPIRFRYIGRLANGNLFDSSCKRGRSSTFTLGSQGWGETLVGMKEGGIRRVVVSPVGGVMKSEAMVYDVERSGLPLQRLPAPVMKPEAMVYDVELAEVVLKPRLPTAPK
jgi:hypothetical protein